MDKERVPTEVKDKIIDEVLYEGATYLDISNKYGIDLNKVYPWLARRKDKIACHHPQGNHCRAFHNDKKKPYCTALNDTDFGARECPFFKSQGDFLLEYIFSNKKNDDEIVAMCTAGYDVSDVQR